jgi:hypothetical protein
MWFDSILVCVALVVCQKECSIASTGHRVLFARNVVVVVGVVVLVVVIVLHFVMSVAALLVQVLLLP